MISNDFIKKTNFRYAGSPELWIEFICAWQKLKGRDLSKNPSFDLDAYIQDFPIDAPESYKHFMAAIHALNFSDSLRVINDPLEGTNFFKIFEPNKVECLAFHDPQFLDPTVVDSEDETLPVLLASSEHRNYSENQDAVFPLKEILCNWVVGYFRDSSWVVYLMINPLVRDRDGEWEGCYLDAGIPVTINFKSFAHLVAYIYMHDVIGFDDMRWRGIESDTLGHSRILFSEV